ncbi:FAD-dependent oxidoreductase [Microbacterium sp.]|uniref:FAD-dependent oxidoreductase n=1 Tax=Microbacterium sp. TaxID=51671 RepID=UPI003A8A7373
MSRDLWDVIVVGGGPAGLSAALMLGRARRRVLVIDAGSPRGRFSSHMHGVLGQEGVTQDEFRERGRAEAAHYGVEFAAGSVTRVEDADGGLYVLTADGESRRTRALIAASGLRDELADVPGLAERWGVTVLHCPYCHGWEVRDRHLGVLTTSPLGLHQAELVRQWSDRVTVFTAGLGALSSETEQRLRSRGIHLEPAPVAEIRGEGTAVAAVRLVDGRDVAVDAVFTLAAPHPHEEFLVPLGLARDEGPFGSFLAADTVGRTSDKRVWAVGNVVHPPANVALSIGAGSSAGADVNATLVSWDFDAAVQNPAAWPQVAPGDFWEKRYAESDRVWSGRVNRVLADLAPTLTTGRALDLGCGEGADVVWLAQQGWSATGIDISPTAVARASAAAEAAGLDAGHARFLVDDLTALPDKNFDLVTASFLHSPVELAREDILRRATAAVAPGGHLLITSHADFPPWADVPDDHRHRFPTPEEQVAQLALDEAGWEIIHAESRPRETTAPDGTPATLDDVVVLVRRR